MAYLHNIIADNDFEMQRLMKGLETTRGATSVQKAKTDHRNECKEKFLNGNLSAIDYLNAIYLTIGCADYNPGSKSTPILGKF